jgi:hypothetical protein
VFTGVKLDSARCIVNFRAETAVIGIDGVLNPDTASKSGAAAAPSVMMPSVSAVGPDAPLRSLRRTPAHVRCEKHRLTGPVSFPPGAWPRRMSAAFAAAYAGELSIEAFLKRVGSDYPLPRVKDGRRQLWVRDDLDRALLPNELASAADIAGDL